MRTPRRIFERVCAERITALTQLEPAEQAVVRATPELMQAIRENQALAGLTPPAEPAPARPVVVEQALRTAHELEETSMTPITRLILGKRWYVQLAFGTAIILALVVLALVLPRPGELKPTSAWAMAEGYVLVYDLGPLPAGSYFYPVYTVPNGTTGVPPGGPYQMHITACPCAVAACCIGDQCEVLNQLECEDEGGYWLAPHLNSITRIKPPASRTASTRLARRGMGYSSNRSWASRGRVCPTSSRARPRQLICIRHASVWACCC